MLVNILKAHILRYEGGWLGTSGESEGTTKRDDEGV